MRSQIATSRPKPPKDLWEQMDKIVGAPIPDNDEGFTVGEYIERYHVGKSQARARLEKLVKEGKLIAGSRRHSVNGTLMRVYRPA